MNPIHVAEKCLGRVRQQGLGRLLRDARLYGRSRRDLGRLLAGIDAQRLHDLQERYGEACPPPGYSKYLNVRKWLALSLYHAYRLGLDRSAPRTVLDIGTGCGYFPYVCGQFSHAAQALDLDTVPMYNGMIDLLNVDRRIWRVNAHQPLPDLGRRFDVVTAFMTCFNRHPDDRPWGQEEWIYFLRDVGHNQLAPGGRVLLSLNEVGYEDRRVIEMFRRRGAKVDEEIIAFASLQAFTG